MGSTKSSRNQDSSRRTSRSAVLRRPPEKGWPRFRYQLRLRWQSWLEANLVWIVIFMAVAIWCLVPRHLFWVQPSEAGTIAGQTYIADRLLSFPNEIATSEAQQRAAEQPLPVYDFDRNLEIEKRQYLAELFQLGLALIVQQGEQAERPPLPQRTASNDEPNALENLAMIDPAAYLSRQESHLKLTEEQARLLLQLEFSSELEDRLSGVWSRVLRLGVVGNKALLLEHRARGITVRDLQSDRRTVQLDLYGYLGYPEQVATMVEQDLSGWRGFDPNQRRILSEFLVANLAPNLTYNSNETLNLRQQAVAEVPTFFHQFRKGEVIVRQGDEIDDLAGQAIAQMASSRDLNRLLQSIFGTFLLLSAVIFLLWLRVGEDRGNEHSRQRLLNESLLLLMLHLVGARFAFFLVTVLGSAIERLPFGFLTSFTYAAPFAALALISVLLFGRQTAFILALTFSLLVGHMAGDELNWSITLYSLVGSLAAISAFDRTHFRQRSITTRAGFIIGLVNMVAVLSLRALSGGSTGGLTQLGFDLLFSFVGGLLAAAVTSFAVPILEALFAITTHIKLLELANPNLPLLRRLAFEAPGTFQHSLAVSNLAKEGCEAIEADSVLVHTAALYHDIGKLPRAQYFIENQVSGQNPHDKIQPSMSALILINHVKDGLELAHKHHLPQPILDAIEQHHGSRLIKFFYNKAKERCDPDTDEIREDEFRYPGPKPQNKEMGVLMLADMVEAASRTLVEPSQQKLRGLLRTLIEDCLKDGQLDQTDLTLGDLRKVEAAFLRVLTNIYHRRIDYPGFDFNRGGRRSKGSSTSKNGSSNKSKRGESSDSVQMPRLTDEEQRKVS